MNPNPDDPGKEEETPSPAADLMIIVTSDRFDVPWEVDTSR